MRKYVYMLLAVLVFGAVAAAFRHPPMRLMPAPLLFQKGGDAILDLAPAMVDDHLTLFYATSRLPVGPRDHRIYTIAPDRRLHFGEASLRIGEGSTLDELREWTTGTRGGDRPFLYLDRMREVATQAPDEPLAPETAAWLADLDATVAASRTGDVIVYVHGANTTVERAAGQAAQLNHFAGRDAAVVLFAWPTAENFLRYPRDIETAFGAAPHLAELIDLIGTHTRARQVDVFTYSAGGTVGSDGLARLVRDHPQAAGRLGQVYHAAPDADTRAFVDDLAVYADSAVRVTTAVNLGDSALRLAQTINRASRAGRPDLRELSPEASEWLLSAARDGKIDLLQVTPDTMPDLSSRSHTFWYDDPWVSNDLLVALLFQTPAEDRGLVSGTSASGTSYWTFPTDYPDRMGPLVALLRTQLGLPVAAAPVAGAPAAP